MDDQEPSWQRQLVIGLSVLVAIGIMIGGIVAVGALTAADFAGVGSTSSSTHSTPEPILPTTGSGASQAPPPSTASTTPASSTPPPAEKAITLSASPKTAGSYQQVNLTGRYPGNDGATLQVQRSVGSGPWADFPTDTRVSAGKFATYIKTGRVGANHFRMLDKATGKTSNVVTVTIG